MQHQRPTAYPSPGAVYKRWVHFMVTWDNAKRITTGFVDGVKSDDLVWRPSGPTSGGFCNVHTGVLYTVKNKTAWVAAAAAGRQDVPRQPAPAQVWIRGEAAMASLLNGDLGRSSGTPTGRSRAAPARGRGEPHCLQVQHPIQAKAATCAYHGEEDQRRISCGYPPKLILGRHPSTSTGATGEINVRHVGFDDRSGTAYRCSLSANCYSFWVYNKITHFPAVAA